MVMVSVLFEAMVRSTDGMLSLHNAGAHLLVVDADIQFNHWELSAKSLVTALLNPLLIHDKLTRSMFILTA